MSEFVVAWTESAPGLVLRWRGFDEQTAGAARPRPQPIAAIIGPPPRLELGAVVASEPGSAPEVAIAAIAGGYALSFTIPGGLTAYDIWLDQPGNAGKTEAEFLSWVAADAVLLVQPYVDAASEQAEVATDKAAEAAQSAAAADGSASAAAQSATAADAARAASVAAEEAAVAAQDGAEAARAGSEAARDAATAARDTATAQAGIAATKANEAAASALIATGFGLARLAEAMVPGPYDTPGYAVLLTDSAKVPLYSDGEFYRRFTDDSIYEFPPPALPAGQVFLTDEDGAYLTVGGRYLTEAA